MSPNKRTHLETTKSVMKYIHMPYSEAGWMLVCCGIFQFTCFSASTLKTMLGRLLLVPA